MHFLCIFRFIKCFLCFFFVQNEAEVCDVLCTALAQMLKDREAPSSKYASCNGPASGHSAATGRDGGGLQEQEAVARWVSSAERKRAAELVRSGEERVLQLCLELVEVRRERGPRETRAVYDLASVPTKRLNILYLTFNPNPTLTSASQAVFSRMQLTFMRVAEHLTALPAWCNVCMVGET